MGEEEREDDLILSIIHVSHPSSENPNGLMWQQWRYWWRSLDFLHVFHCVLRTVHFLFSQCSLQTLRRRLICIIYFPHKNQDQNPRNSIHPPSLTHSTIFHLVSHDGSLTVCFHSLNT